MGTRLLGRFLGVSALMVALAAPGQAADLWMHVQVHEGKYGDHVSVNLPVTAISTAVPIIHTQLDKNTHLRINSNELTVPQMRAIWKQLKASPDMNFVTVKEADQNVRITKSAGYVLIHVDSRDRDKDNVDLRMPIRVVDALLSGTDDQIDVAAGLQALASAGEGDLLTVTSAKDHVRVWVDHVPEGK